MRRTARTIRRFAVTGSAVVVALAAAPARAAQTQPAAAPAVGARQAPLPADPLARAEVLIGQGHDDNARAILLALEKAPSGDKARDNQVQFLLALFAMKDQDYDEAIRRYRRILVSDPKAVRVRLEMGRALFLEGRYADAERQFLYARAGHLPKAVLANVDRFLGAIRQRKTFSYGFAFAITPDSNLNAGPATDAVTLYGLPFQLSPNARANSGVGLTVDGNAEWAPRVGPRAKWRIGGQIHRAQYGQTTFDDMTAALYTGPHLTLKRWDLNWLGTASRRWYGDRGYAVTYGSSADATWYVDPRLGVGLNLAVGRTEYDRNPLQDGLGKSLGASVFYTPTPASFVRGAVTLARQGAQLAGYAFDSTQFGASYVREFRGGLTVGVAPTFTSIRYKAALAAFAVPRHDRQYAVELSLLYRRLDFHGLTPRISYVFIKNASNIDLYRFERNRLTIGFTNAF